ncbi:hypothetical protein JCM10213_007560 [Rhodosporidiobolus nylandii]
MIYPRAWELLQPDDELDEAVLLALKAYELAREQAGAAQDELDDIARQARELGVRRLCRWVQLYALHGVRQRFIAYYRKREPGLTADEIVWLHAAQVEDAPPPPRAAPYSVWPLRHLHGRSVAAVVSPSARCTCNIYLWRCANPSLFILPDVPSPESDRQIYERLGVRRGEPMVEHVGAAKKGE